MKKFVFIGLCVLVFFISFCIAIGYRILKVQLTNPLISNNPSRTSSPEIPITPVEFKNEPPRQSLTGKVINIDGTATKLSRDEEDPVKVTTDTLILQGEQLTSSPSSALQIQFATSALLSVNPQTTVSFPSTNPTNFLTKQDKGVMVYETDEQVATISARSLHALFTVSQGKAQLTVDPDSKLITFMMVRGQGKIGYIDTNNQTQIIDVKENEVVVYDDTKRIVDK